MKVKNKNRGVVRSLTALTVLLTLFTQAKFAAKAAVVTFSSPAYCTADSDVATVGGLSYAYCFATSSQNVNGVLFTAQSSTTTLGGGNVSLSGFSTRNGTVFYTATSPFGDLSAAYATALRGAVYQSPGSSTTVTLNSLLPGHKYVVQVWASDPRSNFPLRSEAIYDGESAVTNVLDYNSTDADGGVGQYIIGTFTADNNGYQNFYLDVTDPNYVTNSSIPQMNAIQLRDVSGVWSGTTDGTWADSDSSSANFSGSSFQAVKALGVTSVQFQD
jgi:hypothetical protein